MFEKLFLQHPRSVGETYTQHAGYAVFTGFRMVLAGLACVVHGILPFLFVRTGSNSIRALHASLDCRQPKPNQPTVDASGLQTAPPQT